MQQSLNIKRAMLPELIPQNSLKLWRTVTIPLLQFLRPKKIFFFEKKEIMAAYWSSKMHPRQRLCVSHSGTVVTAELQLNADVSHSRLAIKQSLVGAGPDAGVTIFVRSLT